jgi:hypothetical protein
MARKEKKTHHLSVEVQTTLTAKAAAETLDRMLGIGLEDLHDSLKLGFKVPQGKQIADSHWTVSTGSDTAPAGTPPHLTLAQVHDLAIAADQRYHAVIAERFPVDSMVHITRHHQRLGTSYTAVRVLEAIRDNLRVYNMETGKQYLVSVFNLREYHER